MLVPLAGVWMSATCPGALVYNLDGPVSLNTAINCSGICPGVPAYFSQMVLNRRPPCLPHLHIAFHFIKLLPAYKYHSQV